jgi:hypothetical protein
MRVACPPRAIFLVVGMLALPGCQRTSDTPQQSAADTNAADITSDESDTDLRGALGGGDRGSENPVDKTREARTRRADRLVYAKPFIRLLLSHERDRFGKRSGWTCNHRKRHFKSLEIKGSLWNDVAKVFPRLRRST